MGLIHLSAGKKARTPYFFDKMQVDVFTLEELCFCICSAAPFLDRSFPEPGLLRWISEELDLPELSEKLLKNTDSKNRLDTVVSAGIILRYAGIQGEEEIGEAISSLNENISLSPEKKKLSAADHILKQGRYHIARRLYDILYNSLPESDRENRALALRGSGRCYALFFYYREAAGCFLRAYEIMRDEEDLILYLSSLRMDMNDDEYLDLLTEHPEYYECSIEAEKRIRSSSEGYESSDAFRKLEDIKSLRISGGSSGQGSYHDALDAETQLLKMDYRDKAVWD